MLEHLFDESLLVALRNGRREMDPNDIHEAKLTEELGFKQPVVYTESDRVAVATHEAGHATVAYFLGKGRAEVLSIIKRRASLGLLAHGDEEERFTRTRSEIESAIATPSAGWWPRSCSSASLARARLRPRRRDSLAAQMVGSFGMSGSLISYDAIAEGPIGSKNLVGRVLGDTDGRPGSRRSSTRRRRVVALLEEQRDVVVSLRDASSPATSWSRRSRDIEVAIASRN